MKRLRLGVAGAGVIGRAHLQRIVASEECDCVALVDPAPAASVLAHEATLPLFRELPAMIDALRPDAVILATPNSLHVSGALQCIAQRVACLVEKPLAETLNDARRLADAARRAAVPVLVGHHRRHSAVLRAACDVIEGGRLGRLVAITGSATFRKPDRYFEEAPWRRQPGGGPILINMVHEVDDLRMLAGDIVEVQAMVSNAARGFEVEDSAAVTLRFANGALGSFMLSDAAAGPRSWEQTSGENPAYDHHADEDCYVIAGERGSLSVPTMRLRSYHAEASWFATMHSERLDIARVDPLAAQLAHFCAVVRGDAAPRVTVSDALRTLAVTLAISEAARSGATVRLDS